MAKNVKALARAASNVRTGGFLGMELKFLDSSYQASLIAAASMAGLEADPSTLLSITSIAQGDGESQRDGRQAVVKSAFVTGTVSCPLRSDQADAQGGNTYFVALVMDTQTNGAQLNSEDVFTNPLADATTIPCLLRDLQYVQRFKVLDYVILNDPPRIVGTDGAATLSIAPASIPFKLSWNGEMRQNYTGTNGIVASIADNSIHVLAGTTSTSGAPQLNYNARIRFVG